MPSLTELKIIWRKYACVYKQAFDLKEKGLNFDQAAQKIKEAKNLLDQYIKQGNQEDIREEEIKGFREALLTDERVRNALKINIQENLRASGTLFFLVFQQESYTDQIKRRTGQEILVHYEEILCLFELFSEEWRDEEFYDSYCEALFHHAYILANGSQKKEDLVLALKEYEQALNIAKKYLPKKEMEFTKTEYLKLKDKIQKLTEEEKEAPWTVSPMTPRQIMKWLEEREERGKRESPEGSDLVLNDNPIAKRRRKKVEGSPKGRWLALWKEEVRRKSDSSESEESLESSKIR